ncbi:NAD(P)H-binding protein [Sphingobium sp. Sx8-8]|uniref:NmrA family NAD(P)-binding protein n=1 Tax=Sphingobium sp. Sx8-8 TaxID=2933617 RepID=UPI001F589FED|nr:NAD(P)H-binding protein [Sphingobium sp. Sx8-8]
MIVLTAPTGNIGHQVLLRLLDAEAPVRVIVRDASKLPETVRTRVEVIEGSHGDQEVVDRAFAGADTLFWLVPPNPTAKTVDEAYVDFTRPAAEALLRHGVKHVVDITALGRGTPWAGKAGLVTSSFRMDDLLAGTGVAFRAVANPSFMDNIARQATAIREKGMFFLPFNGDKKMPAAATRDIAATAVRLLLDTSWVGLGHAAVLGPEDLSFNEMATTMSEVLGKQVRYQQVSFETYRAGFVERGMSDAMAQGMTDMAWAKNEGLDNAEPRTTESTTPTSFRQWCEEELKPALVG